MKDKIINKRQDHSLFMPSSLSTVPIVISCEKVLLQAVKLPKTYHLFQIFHSTIQQNGNILNVMEIF